MAGRAQPGDVALKIEWERIPKICDLWRGSGRREAQRPGLRPLHYLTRLLKSEMSMTDELEKLGRLHKDGALSDAEFAQAKAKLLSQAGGDLLPAPDKPLSEAKFNDYVEKQRTRKILAAIAMLLILLIYFIFIAMITSQHGFRK